MNRPDSHPILVGTDLHASYGARKVLAGDSLSIKAGEIVAVFGRNGAGKSTLLRVLAGLVPAERGTIQFRGADVTRTPAHVRARLGIAHLPQTRGVFPSLTVRENLALAAECSVASGGLPEPLLSSLVPQGLRERRAGLLSIGEQRLVSIAMVAARRPPVMLLDEPSAGLSTARAEAVLDDLRGAASRHGIAVLLVEQNPELALRVADREFVMESGLLEGVDSPRADGESRS